MSLEDSIGDILRKARISTETSVAAAAKAAGLSEADYEAIESTGKAPAVHGDVDRSRGGNRVGDQR